MQAMFLTQIHLIAVYSVAIFYVIGVAFVSGNDVVLQKRSERSRIDLDSFMEEERPRKRPFCNAFTGCGKKRSEPSTFGNLIDYTSEIAAKDLTGRIISEAKFWKAIQIARDLLDRRKQAKQNPIAMDLPFGVTLPDSRKKRSPQKHNEKNNEKNESRKEAA